MLKNISDDIACLLVKKRIVSNEKREMYSYGIIISILLILIYAPVEHKNNPLRAKLKKRNRLIALFLVGIDSITVIICYAFAPHIASSIMIFVILAGILMLLGLLSKSNTTNDT